MINVPHAFTPEYPAAESTSRACKVPVILNVYDGYMSGMNAFDFAVDVEEAFPKMCEMSFCHQSQISEWLPWVGRHDLQTPQSLAEWSQMLRNRFEHRNRELGIRSPRMLEVFTVTAWGSALACQQVLTDLPNVVPEVSNLPSLRDRLARWQGDGVGARTSTSA